jgi:activator of HSP90 ATPase
MAKILSQRIVFKTSPNQLFKFYMDEALHSQITGAKAKIEKDAGSAFSAFQGDIKGKTLYLRANEVVIQSWRYKNWDKNLGDSYLVLVFNKVDEGTELEVTHTNIPEEHFDRVKKGWNDFYWKRWKAAIVAGGKVDAKNGRSTRGRKPAAVKTPGNKRGLRGPRSSESSPS